MFYRILLAGLVLLFASSCSKDLDSQTPDNDTNKALVPVTVHVTGFSVSQEDFPETRATVTALDGYDGVNAVTLAFYNGTTEIYKQTQLLSDNSNYSTFGEFRLSLPTGSYTMVAVAYYVSASTSFALTSATEAAYTGAHAFDTFVKNQAVNITSTDAVDISATLERVVSLLKVVSTDGKTAGVTNVRMTLSAGGRSFNPSTGLATSNTSFVNTVGNNVATGAISTSLTYLFLATDEQTMNVTIETLDANQSVVRSTTVNNVPFKRNRRTILTGPMYTHTSTAGTFQVDIDWLTDAEVNF